MTLAMLDRASFSGHETFPLRYTWLPKSVNFVAAEPQGFNREDALVTLGVGKNMVRAMRHWGMATGMLENEPGRTQALRVTDLGTRLFGRDGWDPYLEDPATLWLAHGGLASTGARATTWYWLFNHLPQPRFTKEELLNWLVQLIQQKQWSRTTEMSLKRDIDVCLRTYVAPRRLGRTPIEETIDCPLVELGLLHELPGHVGYALRRGEQPTLPDAVFSYAVAIVLAAGGTDRKTVSLDEIAFAPGAPGRVFCLSEDALLTRLERLEAITKGALRYDETAGLRQVYVSKLPEPLALLERYYDSKQGGRR